MLLFLMHRSKFCIQVQTSIMCLIQYELCPCMISVVLCVGVKCLFILCACVVLYPA